ncbi:MAG: hypothetical protein JWP59_3186, partial [Massilia sp.]|nr:hypothetical protein [Massilia sp.]
DAAAGTLAGGSRTLDPTQPARFDLQYFVPARAREMLCEPVDPGVLKEWFDTHVRAELTRRGTKFAIIETARAVASQSADRDPKFPLRIYFARCGVTTQFIFNMAAPEPDYPAQGCLFDVVRQSGHLPQPLPRLPSLPAATTVIGVYVDKIKIGSTDALLPVITRTRLGENTAELFVANKSGARGKWLPYHEGICATYAAAALLTPAQASQFVQQALAVPTNVLDEPLILCIHSNLKRIYSGINKCVGLAFPDIGNLGTWIVRVHAGPDTVQISCDETAHPSEPG